MYLILVKYDWKLCLEILAGVIYTVSFLQWERLYNLINILYALGRMLQTLNPTIVPQHQSKLGQSKLKISAAASVGLFSCLHLVFCQKCVVSVYTTKTLDELCNVPYVVDKQSLLQSLNLTIPEGGRIRMQDVQPLFDRIDNTYIQLWSYLTSAYMAFSAI